MSTMPIIVLVVALLPGYGHTSSDYLEDKYGWIDYVKDQVQFEPFTFINYTTVLADYDFKVAQPTQNYEQPQRFYFNFDVPYFVIFYSNKTLTTLGTGMCGGVLLTQNVVMTLCSCVATYIDWKKKQEGQTPKYTIKTLPEDLGQSVYLSFDNKNFSFANPSELKQYYIDNNYTLLNLTEEKQLPNEQCEEAYKDSTKTWLQRASFALLSFKPNYTSEFQKDIFMPWPPKPFVYDLTLKDKGVDASNLHWGLHYARSPVTVIIPSFNYSLNHGPIKAFKDDLGQVIDVRTTLVNFPTTMCDQDFCEKSFPEFLPPDQTPQYATRRLGCFCDHNLDNTVCGGLVGSPIIHEGDVYGLLSSPLLCIDGDPRSSLGCAITVESMDYITQNVPGIFDRLGMEANASKFRDNAIVSNYEIDIPVNDLLPSNLPFSDDPSVFGKSGTHSSQPSEPSTILLLGFVSMFLAQH
ncbi:hypothetical protein GE061_009685 [Apolygus lucorum]|uniref:Peptidase S1 domain-containing protein n=1 Tax=Apolygus lucorum TaxID=248454 RepID=A0A6A4JUQ7_APOLU|nr:hypothetical protein GE061_009685 [Apolygus lucorum]